MRTRKNNNDKCSKRCSKCIWGRPSRKGYTCGYAKHKDTKEIIVPTGRR